MLTTNAQYICISYDGEAISNHSIDVKTLAPALLAFSELIEESYKVVSGKSVPLKIEVTALKPGSFEVFLGVVHADFLSLMGSEDASAIANLLSLLGFAGAPTLPSLIQVLLKSRGKNPEKAIVQKDGNVTLIFDQTKINGNITINNNTFKLYQSLEVREKLFETVKPLTKEGVKTITYKTFDGEVLQTIRETDVCSFDPPDISELEDEVISESTRRLHVSLVNIAMQEDNKWRFSSGGEKPFFAKIEDPIFLRRFNKNEISFRKDDLLEVDMKTIQKRDIAGILKEENIIINVLSHKKAAFQLNFTVEEE